MTRSLALLCAVCMVLAQGPPPPPPGGGTSACPGAVPATRPITDAFNATYTAIDVASPNDGFGEAVAAGGGPDIGSVYVFFGGPAGTGNLPGHVRVYYGVTSPKPEGMRR